MIKKIKNMSYEQILYGLVMIVIIGLPLIKLTAYILYFSYAINDPFIFNHVYVLYATLPLLAGIYIYGLIKKKIEIKLSDVFMLILALLGVVSTIYSVNIKNSLWGASRRYEGIFSLLNYYFLFLNCKNIKNTKYKDNFIKVFFIIGIVQFIYAFLQVFTDLPFIARYSPVPYLAMGLCSNPNFFGSYMVLLSLLAVTLFLTKNSYKYFIFSIIFFVGLCLAGSSGPFLGFLLAFIFLIIFFRKKANLKKILILVVTLITVFYSSDICLCYVQENAFHQEINSSYNIRMEIEDTFNVLINHKKKHPNDNNDLKELGNGRIDIWMKLLPLTKYYWPIGSGIDTIENIYPQYGLLIFDKAHNVYLQILLTNGVFALTAYCLICLIIFIKTFKTKNYLTLAFYIAFIGYSIQAFANISVIEVAPYFFIVLGFLYSYLDEKDIKEYKIVKKISNKINK